MQTMEQCLYLRNWNNKLRVASWELLFQENKFTSCELLFTSCSFKGINLRVPNLILRVALLLHKLKLKTCDFKK